MILINRTNKNTFNLYLNKNNSNPHNMVAFKLIILVIKNQTNLYQMKWLCRSNNLAIYQVSSSRINLNKTKHGVCITIININQISKAILIIN